MFMSSLSSPSAICRSMKTLGTTVQPASISSLVHFFSFTFRFSVSAAALFAITPATMHSHLSGTDTAARVTSTAP